MGIRAVVFDIGGVLEITQPIGVTEKWEQHFQLQPGELDKRLYEVWKGGSIGTMSEAEVHRNIGEIMGVDQTVVNAFMEDIWKEYLGEPNTELIKYFRCLRPPYQTAIISNSFVGAREREQARYKFGDMTDFIIYSHEVGMTKPNPDIFKMTWERLNIQPDEMIFLDDVEMMVEAARELGIHAVHFQNNQQAIGEIQACLVDPAP